VLAVGLRCVALLKREGSASGRVLRRSFIMRERGVEGAEGIRRATKGCINGSGWDPCTGFGRPESKGFAKR